MNILITIIITICILSSLNVYRKFKHMEDLEKEFNHE